jgi:hypothetical protein
MHQNAWENRMATHSAPSKSRGRRFLLTQLETIKPLYTIVERFSNSFHRKATSDAATALSMGKTPDKRPIITHEDLV